MIQNEGHNLNVGLKDEKPDTFIVHSKIYATAGRWSDAMKVIWG